MKTSNKQISLFTEDNAKLIEQSPKMFRLLIDWINYDPSADGSLTYVQLRNRAKEIIKKINI